MADSDDNGAMNFDNDLNGNGVGSAESDPDAGGGSTGLDTSDCGLKELANLFNESTTLTNKTDANNEIGEDTASRANGGTNTTSQSAPLIDTHVVENDLDSCDEDSFINKFNLFDDEEVDPEHRAGLNNPGSKLQTSTCTSVSEVKTKVNSKPPTNDNMEMSKTKSDRDMKETLEQLLETGKISDTLKEIGAEKYQLVVEKKNESTDGADDEEDDLCCICLDEHTDPKILHKCSHKFCTECIDQYFKIKPVCPRCFVAYGVITGNQPKGYMSDSIAKKVQLPGYESYNAIVVHYSFGDGIQTHEHPNPGIAYHGTSRTAYLPNNTEGQKVLALLKEAFKRRLTFTVGASRTTGCENVVTWNDIHHKTCTHGGQESFGYPDPTYLSRVQEELASLGVTEESMKEHPS